MEFSKWVLCLSVLILLAKPAVGQDCGSSVSALVPCESYLLGMGSPTPSARCCTSAQALNKAAATKAARKTLCQCLKQVGGNLGVDYGRVNNLPKACKLNLHLNITKDIDCNKV